MKSLGLYVLLLLVATMVSVALEEPLRPKSALGWLFLAPLLLVCYLAAEYLSGRLLPSSGEDQLAPWSVSWRRLLVGLVLLIPLFAIPAIAVWLVRSRT